MALSPPQSFILIFQFVWAILAHSGFYMSLESFYQELLIGNALMS